jgi:hypothetical protein
MDGQGSMRTGWGRLKFRNRRFSALECADRFVSAASWVMKGGLTALRNGSLMTRQKNSMKQILIFTAIFSRAVLFGVRAIQARAVWGDRGGGDAH